MKTMTLAEKSAAEKRAEGYVSKLEGWLKDGDTWLGVFENQDIGHGDIGQRCVFPFSSSDGSWDKAVLGQTQAPDGKHIGMGWRYLVICKTKDAREAARWLVGLEGNE